MADNITSPVAAGTILSSDDIGGGVQVARSKITFGVDGTSTDVNAGAPLPVDYTSHGAATDRGGTITTGGSAQQLMAANATRRGFSVQNQSNGDLYINGSATATVDYHSLKIVAGGYFEINQHSGVGAISIIGATTGQAFYAREW